MPDAATPIDITYPLELPITGRREEIARAIAAHQVVIVSGETGSGKTTQIPKILLQMGYGGGTGPAGSHQSHRHRPAMIAHTQPRRIAARATAERVSQELGTELGQTVGYQVRFADHSSPATRLKVMTDGVLLAQIQHDPRLLAYDAIIIDEAHERSLNIDFLLGYLSNLLPRRPDLKLIITSATIDSDLFATHFGRDAAHPAPVIEVSGRTYPVELRYRPLGLNGVPEDQPTAIVAAARELMRQGDGDILVFCSGEREIRDAADALNGDLNRRSGATRAGATQTGARHGAKSSEKASNRDLIEVLPLYSRLSAAEQHRVFEPHGARRIVLATNVAETSLTVPGIHYVIDPGTARISRYSKATKVQRLPIEPVSQASANQRAGRCGRIAKGICVRLYDREDYETRPAFTDPEILRTSLASVILRMLAVGVVSSPGEVARFPFVQPPDTRAVTDGVRVLKELGAIEELDGRTKLTAVGQGLARIPLDPRLARMIIEASRLGVEREVIIVAAALSIQDPRERPQEFQAQADQFHARFKDPTSDFLTYLNLWEYLRSARHASSSSAFRRLARREYLNYLRIREWQDLVKELSRAARSATAGGRSQNQTKRPMPLSQSPAKSPVPEPAATKPATTEQDKSGLGDPAASANNPWRLDWPADQIHRALLQGLLSQIGLRQVTPVRAKGPNRRPEAKRERGPAQYLGARGISFAIYPGSALRTKQPSWVMSAELVETSRLWGRVCADINPEWVEQAAPHLTRRSYANPRWQSKRGAGVIDEKVLVYGLPVVAARPVPLSRVDPAMAREMFIRHALVEGDWRTHHQFFRLNRELLERAQELANRSRAPGQVFDSEDLFDFYDQRLPASIGSVRHFDAWWKKARVANPDQLTLSADLALEAPNLGQGFPDTWTPGGLGLALTYEYMPGEDQDGVTVHIPVRLARRAGGVGLDWQVPGLRQDLIAALIKSLPKPLRAELLPAQETARKTLENLGGPMDWLNADGQVRPLTEALSTLFRQSHGVHLPPDAWSPEVLPDHLKMTFQIEDPRGGIMASGHSLGAVVAQVAPRIDAAIGRVVAASLKSPGQAGSPAPADDRGPGQAALDQAMAARNATEADTRAATRELLLQDLALAPGRLLSRLRPEQALPLAASRYPSPADLALDAQRAVIGAALDAGGVPENQAAYDQFRSELRERLEDTTYGVLKTASALIVQGRQIETEASHVAALAVLNSATDIKDHAARLLDAGFLSRAGLGRLNDLKRYLAADAYRLDRLGINRAREDQGLRELAELDRAYQQALASAVRRAAAASGLAEVPWMIEEFRVSLFAQQLGTKYPVSAKRIRRVLERNESA
ncbi:MAG: DUF3418 domain-containing protein [Bifidobacteriaceae bacterium]|nr:DUF3418 domain-containing protein [Bifidobacteriaceae bacterium]